jgi:hypothetical protein
MDRLRDGWWALIGRLVCEWVGAFLVWVAGCVGRLHLASWSEGFGPSFPIRFPNGSHSTLRSAAHDLHLCNRYANDRDVGSA